MYWNRESYIVTRELWVLNSNIRCIEINYVQIGNNSVASWIVTLDVLKFSKERCGKYFCTRWIVTLDVLKYYIHSVNYQKF